MSTRQEIAEICKHAREEAGFNQRELSLVMGIPQFRIEKLELGKVKINEGEASTYSLYFKIDPRLLVEKGPAFYDALPEIKRVVDLRNVNLSEMARAFGLSKNTISAAISNGTRFFLKKELDDISFYLNIPVKTLMTKKVPEDELPEERTLSYIMNHPWQLVEKERAMKEEVTVKDDAKTEEVENLKAIIEDLRKSIDSYKTEIDILSNSRNDALNEKHKALEELSKCKAALKESDDAVHALEKRYLEKSSQADEYKNQLFEFLLKEYKDSH